MDYNKDLNFRYEIEERNKWDDKKLFLNETDEEIWNDKLFMNVPDGLDKIIHDYGKFYKEIFNLKEKLRQSNLENLRLASRLAIIEADKDPLEKST